MAKHKSTPLNTSAPAIESVPAPGEPASELHRVRKAKNRHVKAQNWEIAALYREIEKALQQENRKCSNCQHMLSAIGVGQGLICDLNKCRIPHSQHSCRYFLYEPKEVTQSAETASFDSEQQEEALQQLATQAQELGLYSTEVSDEQIYAESAKRGYTMLASQLAWEDGAKWHREQSKNK